MTTYNIYQLRKYAEKFLRENYQINLDIPLTLNARMRRTCGWFRFTRSGIAKCIELNKYFVENNEPVVVLDVLRHELVHYALFVEGKPNKDGHPVFENELKRLNIVSQSTINKYTIDSKPTNISVYKCKKCNQEYKRKRALPNGGKNYKCNCGGGLLDLGKRLVK